MRLMIQEDVVISAS